MAEKRERPTLLELFFAFLRISAITIGGGYVMFPLLKSEMVDSKGWISSEEMVDYYALPQTGNKAWPGRYAAAQLPFHEKARMIEEALNDDIVATMGDVHPDRFIPFIMMHEFEGMLFSDCQRFGIGIGREDLVAAFQAIRDQFATPEEINDSSRTAPSKRILDLIPGYQKPLFGTLAALEIGLEAIRKECPHFDGWLTRLESLPSR